jgi:hypothetical protein
LSVANGAYREARVLGGCRDSREACDSHSPTASARGESEQTVTSCAVVSASTRILGPYRSRGAMSTLISSKPELVRRVGIESRVRWGVDGRDVLPTLEMWDPVMRRRGAGVPLAGACSNLVRRRDDC